MHLVGSPQSLFPVARLKGTRMCSRYLLSFVSRPIKAFHFLGLFWFREPLKNYLVDFSVKFPPNSAKLFLAKRFRIKEVRGGGHLTERILYIVFEGLP